MKAQRREKTTGNTDGAKKTDKPSRRSAAPPLPWYEDSAPVVRNNVAATAQPRKTQYEQSGFLSASVGPGTGRRGPFDSCPLQVAATSRRAQSLPPERRGKGTPPPEDDDPGGEEWGDWDEEDWNENEEEEEERDSQEEDDEEGEGPPRTAQRSRPPPGGGPSRL